jgi:hypothetical protein
MSIHPLDPLVQAATAWWVDRLDDQDDDADPFDTDARAIVNPSTVSSSQRQRFGTELAMAIWEDHNERRTREDDADVQIGGPDCEILAKALKNAHVRHCHLPAQARMVVSDETVIASEAGNAWQTLFDSRAV